MHKSRFTTVGITLARSVLEYGSMDLLTVATSVLGGGLAGGCVNVLHNRASHARDLRTKFYPVLNNMHSAYIIRMENPEGRYWTIVVGYVPSKEDEEFVSHRAQFVSDLIQFNELKEVRKLRKVIMDKFFEGHDAPGSTVKYDLAPECKALSDCLDTLHKKLDLD
jgi:hypothetical protein